LCSIRRAERVELARKRQASEYSPSAKFPYTLVFLRPYGVGTHAQTEGLPWATFDVFGKAKMEAQADKANSLSKAFWLCSSRSPVRGTLAISEIPVRIALLYPSATSKNVITENPAANAMVPIPRLSAVAGTSSVTTTESIAPAAKPKR